MCYLVQENTLIFPCFQLRDQQDYDKCEYQSTAIDVIGDSYIIDFETKHPILLDLPESKVSYLFNNSSHFLNNDLASQSFENIARIKLKQ